MYVHATDRYWVHKTVYQNFFSSPGELADWQLIEDDGTGGFVSSGNGSAILTMDDGSGGFANRLFSINGAAPRLMPFDQINGRVELLVKSITGGNQRIFLQAQEFDGSGTYLGQVNILPAQSATGFFSVNLSSVTWDGATAQVRFIIGGENFSGQQGTVEFGYFSYSNTNNNWNNAANWSASSNGAGGASIPGPSDNVIFDGAGNSNGSCLLDINASVNLLTLTNNFSGNLDMQNFQMMIGTGGIHLAGGGITGAAQDIQVAGNVSVSGGAFKNPLGNTFISGDVYITGGIVDFNTGTVVLNGTSDQQFSSTVFMPINNFVVNKSSGAVNFSSDILVAGSLVLTNGILNTNSNTVRLGTGSATTGSLVIGAGSINGNFARWISPASTGNISFPFGNTSVSAPLVIQVVNAPSSAGVITSFYNNAAPGFTSVSFPDNATTILQRSNVSWTVQTSGFNDGIYSLSVSDDHLGTVNNLSDLHLTLANSVVGTQQAATGSQADPIINRSGLSAQDLANTFFGSLTSAALPVTWLSFDIRNNGAIFTWAWQLSSEENVMTYQLQYSPDGINYITSGEISALNKNHIYYFSAPLTAIGTTLFRIKEIDKDGKISYSVIKKLSASNKNLFSFYPNPAKSEITIHWPNTDATIIHSIITNALGKIIIDRKDTYAISLIISVRKLAAGSYFITCQDNNNHRLSNKLIIQARDW